MVTRKNTRAALSICFLVFLLAGCQGVVPIQVKPFKQPERKVIKMMYVGDLARNVRKEAPRTIGYHTLTIFAIRTFPIRPTTPPGMQDAMTEHIKSALRTAGYDITVVPSNAKHAGPVLRGEIRKFWFSSYWWFWPVTCVGGDIKMQLILEDPQGKTLWEKECKGGGFMVLPSIANVDFLVKDAATQVCNKVIRAVTSESFRNAYETGNDLAQSLDRMPTEAAGSKENASRRKVRGYRVDTSRRDATGKFVRTPVYYENNQ